MSWGFSGFVVWGAFAEGFYRKRIREENRDVRSLWVTSRDDCDVGSRRS